MGKTVTLKLTMPKELYKKLEMIAHYEKRDPIDVIAWILNYSAASYRPNRNPTGNPGLEEE